MIYRASATKWSNFLSRNLRDILPFKYRTLGSCENAKARSKTVQMCSPEAPEVSPISRADIATESFRKSHRAELLIERPGGV